MGLCNLNHIDAELSKRAKAEQRYRERLSGANGIKLCPLQENVKHNHAYFPVVFDKKNFGKSRDEVADILSQNNIFARKYFYPVTNEFSCYKGKYKGETPVAKNVSENILCLPMYADLTIDDVDLICDIILK